LRSYAKNSPEAAARIVALTLVADGVATQSEFEALRQVGAAERLGMNEADVHRVVHELCEDLLEAQVQQGRRGCSVDTLSLNAMLSEVDDVALQETTLFIALQVAEADAHLSEEEMQVLAHTALHWGVHPVVLMPGAPLTGVVKAG
jgi:uncharacterized tellurite resistance protein B-like protein